MGEVGEVIVSRGGRLVLQSEPNKQRAVNQVIQGYL